MKKALNNFRKNYLQRIFAFIILEIFILTSVPSGVYPAEKKINNNDNNTGIFKMVRDFAYKKLNTIESGEVGMPVVLSYSADKDQNILYMSWNQDDDLTQKYYVFSKKAKESEFKLVSDQNGLSINFYACQYRENIGAEFVVAKISDELQF